MSFWTSQRLEEELPHLIDGYSKSRVDCNAYRLRVGDECYVSPTDQTPEPKSVSIRRLEESAAFTIPPGQFAFLITEECIRVPKDAMAFISMRAKIKCRGLVNVSGFHVDPGYAGRLVFSVFNAGPTVIHMKRGDEIFLIWYASLIGESAKHKTGVANTSLSPELVNALSGELNSLEGLGRKISELEKKLNERLNRVEPKHAELITRLTILITIATAVLILFAREVISSYDSGHVAKGQVQSEGLPQGAKPSLGSHVSPDTHSSSSQDQLSPQSPSSAASHSAYPPSNTATQSQASGK